MLSAFLSFKFFNVSLIILLNIFCFSSLKGIAEDENYEYYYYDGLKKIYIFDKKEYGLVDSFPIVDKYFQGNTSLDDIREVMTY